MKRLAIILTLLLVSCTKGYYGPPEIILQQKVGKPFTAKNAMWIKEATSSYEKWMWNSKFHSWEYFITVKRDTVVSIWRGELRR